MSIKYMLLIVMMVSIGCLVYGAASVPVPKEVARLPIYLENGTAWQLHIKYNKTIRSPLGTSFTDAREFTLPALESGGRLLLPADMAFITGIEATHRYHAAGWLAGSLVKSTANIIGYMDAIGGEFMHKRYEKPKALDEKDLKELRDFCVAAEKLKLQAGASEGGDFMVILKITEEGGSLVASATVKEAAVIQVASSAQGEPAAAPMPGMYMSQAAPPAAGYSPQPPTAQQAAEPAVSPFDVDNPILQLSHEQGGVTLQQLKDVQNILLQRKARAAALKPNAEQRKKLSFEKYRAACEQYLQELIMLCTGTRPQRDAILNSSKSGSIELAKKQLVSTLDAVTIKHAVKSEASEFSFFSDEERAKAIKQDIRSLITFTGVELGFALQDYQRLIQFLEKARSDYGRDNPVVQLLLLPDGATLANIKTLHELFVRMQKDADALRVQITQKGPALQQAQQEIEGREGLSRQELETITKLEDQYKAQYKEYLWLLMRIATGITVGQDALLASRDIDSIQSKIRAWRYIIQTINYDASQESVRSDLDFQDSVRAIVSIIDAVGEKLIDTLKKGGI